MKPLSRRDVLTTALTSMLASCIPTPLLVQDQISPEIYEEYTPSYQNLPNLPAIVFNHGLTQDSTRVEQYVVFFTQRGYPTYIWDYPGHGKSADNTSSYSFRGFLNQLNNGLMRWDIKKPVYFGYSLGGMLSLRAALDQPDNYSGLIILLSADTGKHIPKEAILKQEEEKPFGLSFDPMAGAALSLEMINFDVRERISELKKPVLLVGGENDMFFPPYIVYDFAQRLEESSIPNELLMLPNHVHSIPTYLDHEDFLTTREFLGKNLEVFQN